jgi:hypothetical protein
MVEYKLFMKKEIELHQKKVEYTLKLSKRARRMRLAIYGDGAFVVTAPPFVGLSTIEQFILRKSQWVVDKIEYFKQFSGRVIVKNTKQEFALHKKSALILAIERMAYFNDIYQFKWGKVTIRNQKTRWGSCSKKGNINFNYKIALLPAHIADYIIVHELCHLKEFNHSRNFWNLVAQAVPNHLDIRKELKKTGVSFF